MKFPVQIIFKEEPGRRQSIPARVQFSLGRATMFYGDVIEIKPTGEKSADFLRVVKRSGLRVSCRTIGNDIIDSPLLQHLLEKIMQLSGNWERAFGGVLLVHLPESVELDLDAELQAIAESC